MTEFTDKLVKDTQAEIERVEQEEAAYVEAKAAYVTTLRNFLNSLEVPKAPRAKAAQKPKKRGRPKKKVTKTSNNILPAQLERSILLTAPKKKRGRPKGSKNKPT